jgi:hypothetical protein
VNLSNLSKLFSVGSAMNGSAALAILFGVAYTARCDIDASSRGESFQQCWLTGGAFMGIGSGIGLGYNIPNPKLDKPRHNLAENLAQAVGSVVAPPPDAEEDDATPAPPRSWSNRPNLDPSGRLNRRDPRG